MIYDIVFIVAIGSVVGWITCGICCCCNCRCFPCGIKSSSLFPFLVICTIMSLIVIICCIVGLVKTKSLFKGISNVECSVLNFINEGIEGESKLTLPKWGGIYGVIETLNNTIIELEKIKLDDKFNSSLYNDTKTQFESFLINESNIIKNEQKYKCNYLSKNYILDIAKELGEYNYLSKNFTEGSYCDRWVKRVDELGNGEQLYFQLKEILQEKTIDLLSLAIEYISTLYYNLQDMKDLIGDEVVKYSDLIDKYGKIVIILLFSFLLFFTLVSVMLLIIYSFLCHGNIFIKVLLHINWNILAFLMVLVFLVGTFFTLIGKMGTDIIGMFNYIISEKNLESELPLLFNDGTLLNECIHKNGNLVKVFELEIVFDVLNSIKSYIIKVDDLLKDILLIEYDLIYESLIQKIQERKKFKNFNFGFVEENVTDYSSMINLKLDTCVSNLNDEIKSCSIKERWSFSCKKEFSEFEEDICKLTIGDKCMNPLTCNNDELLQKYNNTECTKAKELSKVVNTIFSSINFAANESEINSLYNIAGNISKEYISTIEKNKKILEFYKTALSPLISIFDVFVGNHPITEFLNCQFLGTDIRVMLYYLHNKVTKDCIMIAVTLIICGLVLGISISFIISIIIIINNEIKNMKNVKKISSLDISNTFVSQSDPNNKSNTQIGYSVDK